GQRGDRPRPTLLLDHHAVQRVAEDGNEQQREHREERDEMAEVEGQRIPPDRHAPQPHAWLPVYRFSRGSPRIRWATMFRCTSLVPPAIVMERPPSHCRPHRPLKGACGSSMSAAQGPRTSIAVSENSCVSCVLLSFMAAERCGFIRPRSESVSVRIPE